MLQFILILSLWNSKDQEVTKESITKYKLITNNFWLSEMPNRIKTQAGQSIVSNSTTEVYKNVLKSNKRMFLSIISEKISKTLEVQTNTSKSNNKQV